MYVGNLAEHRICFFSYKHRKELSYAIQSCVYALHSVSSADILLWYLV